MAPKRDPPVKFNRPSGGLSSNNPLEQTSLGDGGISSTRSALAADANGSPEVEMQNFTHETFKEFLKDKGADSSAGSALDSSPQLGFSETDLNNPDFDYFLANSVDQEGDSHQKGDDDFATGNSQELGAGTRDNSSKPAGDIVGAASIDPNATQGTTSGLGPLREEPSKSTHSKSRSLTPALVNKSPRRSLSQGTSPISSNSRMPTPSLDIQNSPQSLKRASEKRAYVPRTKRQIGDLAQRDQSPKRLKLAELFPLRNLFCDICGDTAGATSEFVICGENGCTMQVCVGAPDRECYTRIDPSPLASSVWLCTEHQHRTVLNYQCNRQLNVMYKVYVLNPLIIVHVYGSDEDIVPTSINWRHLEDFFSASADQLLLYISINSKGVEYDEGRRKARYSIEEAVARFPGADLALIISAHSAADGSLVHKVKETVNYCKSTPLGFLHSVLGVKPLETLMSLKGVKLALALTCGKTFVLMHDAWKDLMTARFDFFVGFLDSLVVKNVAEDIPPFLRMFFMTDWSRHGRATPTAFREAISIAFVGQGTFATHPLIYAIQNRFFRYAPSVAHRAPWSLPQPHCSNCGPGSQVITHKFYAHQDPAIAKYRCKACDRFLVMNKPDGLKSGPGVMWEVEWETYVKWTKEAASRSWATSPNKQSECKTVEEYLDRYLPNSDPVVKLGLTKISPKLSRERFEFWMARMGIPRGYWDPLIRIVMESSSSEDTL